MEKIKVNETYNECCKITMKRMQDDSIEMIFTSPPYFQQRAYDAEHQIFNEDENCNHFWICLGATEGIGRTTKDKTKYGLVCYHCEAYKTQLGTEKFLEDTEIEFEMMEVKEDLTVKELREVLENLKGK
jgi:DNA modification methylase